MARYRFAESGGEGFVEGRSKARAQFALRLLERPS